MTMHDDDTAETRDWLDALGAVVQHRGPDRANHIGHQGATSEAGKFSTRHHDG